jgi:hypothetical protein
MQALKRASWKLKNRVRRQATREPPRPNILTDLFDPVFAIEIDEIEGKLHSKGVDSFTGNDP